MKYIIAIVIFCVIVLVHELGHFLLAKYNKVTVTEFSLGLGPTLVGIQKGETKYSIKLLPFGGACMMLGEDAQSKDKGAFGNASVWARISIILAGPFFNFLLAFLMAVIVIGNVGYDSPTVSAVTEGYPAEEAGIQEGDTIVKLNNQNVHFYRDIALFSVLVDSDEAVSVTYERDGELYTVEIEPEYDENSNRYYLGMSGGIDYVRPSAVGVLKYSMYELKYWMTYTVDSLKIMVSGKVSVDDVSGPVGLTKYIGDSYDAVKDEGSYYVWLNMLFIAIWISTTLGVMNLLPIPALDGGRLVFLIIEAIRGKKVSETKEGIVHLIGFVLLMLLMVFVLFNDIRKLFI